MVSATSRTMFIHKTPQETIEWLVQGNSIADLSQMTTAEREAIFRPLLVAPDPLWIGHDGTNRNEERILPKDATLLSSEDLIGDDQNSLEIQIYILGRICSSSNPNTYTSSYQILQSVRTLLCRCLSWYSRMNKTWMMRVPCQCTWMT